ncbi:MAG: family 2A encapsulin nanocompartment cargo protein cysteine desulfurase [Niastella sp.]|uniref:family 2A encapsulin nanocompartment cargo protein cysteine desulfurase n=1 Tax=Niastella sp. TaxID=1869183 RepID=UPI00389AE0E1
MSENNHQANGLPDLKILEQLANQFFKASPSEQSAIPTYNLGQPIPRSLAGSGISPSALEQGSVMNINDPQTSLPDPHFTNGQIPRSVAGSGISPSVKNEDYKEQSPTPFNIEGPGSFEQELQQIVQRISSFVPVSQLPGLPDFSGSSFYFLSKKQLLPGNIPAPYDVNRVKADFPILQQQVNGRPLVWLDNAATTQKPKQVIERISRFYETENSNIHRAAHELAARATDAYENARKKVQGFLNASSVNEIVFVRGSTEAINLVAQSWGNQYLKAGDEIVVSYLEHHANIVPWQQLAEKKGLVLRVIPVDNDGQILLEEYAKLLNAKTKLVSFTQVSNALGTVTPAKQMIQMAQDAGAKVLLDGAQAVSHLRVDVQALNCDWYVFSGHKVFGPTGIGVLYGKEALLNDMQPWQGGGNMIKDVTFEHTVYQQSPARFEAGTGNIADAVGLGAAIDYVTSIGLDLVNQYEHYLLTYATGLLSSIKGLRLIGTAADKAGVLSFVLDGFKTEEVGAYLNKHGIAVRSGHHCAQPVLRRFGVESTVRPSLALYNTCEDVDALVHALHHLRGNK